mgnify:CR=1 FL=1
MRDDARKRPMTRRQILIRLLAMIAALLKGRGA